MTLYRYVLHLHVFVQDITPPVITNWLADIIQQVNVEQQSIAISWTEPTATGDMTPTNQVISVATHQGRSQLFLTWGANGGKIFFKGGKTLKKSWRVGRCKILGENIGATLHFFFLYKFYQKVDL